LAKEGGNFKGIGKDLVAMCANDLLVYGAEPLFFLDYMAFPRLDLKEGVELMEGIVEGCEEARMALLGGETAEMPGVYRKDAYDLAGFAVGVVERRKIIDGSAVRVGARIIGLASSGPHSNGFSLIRKILKEHRLSLSEIPSGLSEPLGKLLLEPTKIYARVILPLVSHFPVLAMAHITGGGLWENLPRVLPRSARAVLDAKSWEIPQVFRFLEEAGRVSPQEMFRVFNMGIGFVLIVAEEFVKPVLEMVAQFGGQAFEIGAMEPRKEGEPAVVISGISS
jgi:phosphoribosylformylglycinamidine cyclo-ligase